jgi:DUF4097 and DUF4098 domain-containing protein YvlB
MKKLVVLAGLILFLGCVDQGIDIGERLGLHKEELLETFENTLEAEEISLDFRTYNGYIEIHLWDREEYKIEVSKWARAATSAEAAEKVQEIQVTFSETEKAGVVTLTVDMEYEKNAGADIRAYLPEIPFDTVELSSSNGHIETEEIGASSVSLDTSNGHIQTGAITASSVSLETSNGYVDATVTADDIRVRTSNGRIGGFFQGETVDLDTSNGSIDIECGDGGKYTIQTSNARIDVTTGSRGEFDISTSNGTIDILVLSDFNFDLRTSNAAITVKADSVTYETDSKDHKEGSTAAETEVSVRASTSNSDITVRKL